MSRASNPTGVFRLAIGAEYALAEAALLAQVHFFKGSVTGPWQSPQGAIPGTSVTSGLSADGIVAGVGFRY